MKNPARFALCVVLALLAQLAMAAPPPTINYQGFLTSPTGTPINGTAAMTFRLYDVASGGSALYTESQPSVTLTNGIFNVLIGAVTPLTLPFDEPYWLGVTISPDLEMSPRQPLSSSPYAFLAPTQSLPTTPCRVDQIIRWSGTAWVCATSALAPGCLAGQTVTGTASGRLQCTLPAPVTTTAADFAANVGSFSSIAVGADGRPIISYYDVTNQALKVLKCGNAECSSGNVISTLDSTGNVGQYSSIAIANIPGNNNAAISYYDATNGDLKFARCNNTNCTTATTLTLDSAGDVGRFSSIAITSDFRPVISYRDITNSSVKVLKCSNGNCSSSNATNTIATVGSSLDNTAITLTPAGLPLVCYTDSVAGANGSRLAICGDAACSTHTSSGFNSSATFRQCSVAAAANGTPAWSYHDLTNTDLRVSNCFNANCDTGTITTTPDFTGDVGSFNALAMPADGLPIIAYFDNTNGDLKVLKCGNSQCSSSNIITPVDIVGNVGQHVAIALPSDGLAVISYYDVTNGNLKIHKCANSACTP